MSTPKNNLEEYRRRAQANASVVVTVQTAASKTSKFKPAKSIESGSLSNVSARRPVSGLPSFSTPNFGKSTSALSGLTTPLSLGRDIIDVSSDESMSIESGGSGPLKRSSSDNSFYDPSSSTSKRVRKDVSYSLAAEDSNKENVRGDTPNVVSQEQRQHRLQGYGAQSSPGKRKQQSARGALVKAYHLPRAPGASTASSTKPSQSPVIDEDLSSKSEEELRRLLMYNQAKAFEVGQDITKVETGQEKFFDIYTLKAHKRILEDRLVSIQVAIDRLKTATTPSFMHPLSSEISSAFTAPGVPSSSFSFSDSATSSGDEPQRFAQLSKPGASISRAAVSSTYQLTDKTTAMIQEALSVEEEEDVAKMWNAFGDFPVHVVSDDNRARAASTSAVPAPATVSRASDRSVSDSAIVPLYDREPITDSPYTKEIMAKLSSVFGMKTFRQNQQKAIITTMDGRDVLVLMPTGGGKSLCYQLPAICQTGKTRGVTFVISPLLALMSDQVQSLMQKGIDVVCFSSDQSDETNTEAWRKLTGKRKPALAYVTPEKLESSDKMRDTMRRLYDNKELARFVIDEAHVISSWGRNFRTAYKHLDRLRRDYPDVPIMALTATANKKTRKDIIDRLGIGNCEVLLQSFNRPNLHYTVRHKRKGKLGIEDMATFIKSEHPNETGIIYSNSRDKCEEVAKELREKYGLRAKHFHAKMHNEDKRRVQKGWQDGEFEIIVATIAFGMGIDKRDVRFVIHYSLSKSLDAYAQETGRAGRDGQPSDCVLYYGSSDVNTLINQIRGDEDLSQEDKRLQINEVWQMAYYCLNDVDCRRAQLLAFFDQPFDPKDCDASCNNCVEPKELKQEDVTRQATNAVKLLQSMLEREAHITQALCVNTLRGSKSAEVTKKDFDKLPLHGSAADMPMNQVQRLFTLLYCLSAFDIHTVSNGNWNYEYMKLGPRADAFIRGKQKVTMSVAVRSNSSTAGGKPPRKKPSQKSRSASAEEHGTELTSHDDDPIVEDDYSVDATDLTMIDDEVVEVTPAHATREAPKPSKSTTCDPNERCIKELRDIRKMLVEKESLQSEEEVLSDECLEMLCLTSIKDFGDFRRVLSETYEPGLAEIKRRRYEEHFLNICINKTIAEENSSRAKGGAKLIPFDANDMQTRYAYASKPPSTRSRPT